MAAATPPPNRTLISDADCAFCQRSLAWGRRHLRQFPAAVGFQVADLGALGVTRAQAESSIWLVSPRKARQHGAGAVAAILRTQPGLGWRLAGAVMAVPPISWAAAGIYALISRNRHRLPGGSASCAAPSPTRRPPTVRPPHRD